MRKFTCVINLKGNRYETYKTKNQHPNLSDKKLQLMDHTKQSRFSTG